MTDHSSHGSSGFSRHVPGAARLYRTFLYVKSESRAVVFTRFHWLLKYGEWRARWLARRDVKNRMKRQQLIPDYQVGCNRILLANDWYSSVDLPHVNLVTQPIQEVADKWRRLLPMALLHNARCVGTWHRFFGLRSFSRRCVSLVAVGARFKHRMGARWPRPTRAFQVHGFLESGSCFTARIQTYRHSSILLMLESQIHYGIGLLAPA